MKTTKRRLAAVLAVVVVIGTTFGIIFRRGNDRDLLLSGTVEATEAQLGFQAAGRVDSILVREGDTVRGGDELGRLDRTEMEAHRQQASAQADAARALLAELEHGFRSEEVAQARAARDGAQERLNDAQRDLDRANKLYEGGALSREALDKARTATEVAQSQYAQVAEQLRLVQSGARKEKIDAQKAQLAQAEASVRSIDAVLANMIIRAPFAGIVTIRHREPGEIVPAGAPVLTVMNRDDRWVRVYVPEDRVGAVHVGLPATIRSDTYPGRIYRGQVVYIASEAEFTPKTVQTSEERVKLVYAVKVRISDDPGYELKPGMPADVRLEASPS